MAAPVRVLAAALLAAGLALTPSPGDDKAPAGKPAAYRFSGPYTQGNLTVYLVHGDDAVKGREVLTLDEALKQKKVVVHETQNVNQLAIENVSTSEVFVQAGDIVRGGQQDRTFAYDLLVPPKSGRVPLPAFCVEAGRWAGRGAEAKGTFSRSMNYASGNALSLAVRKGAMQRAVWDNVARKQAVLGAKVKASVQAAASASSLELTLGHQKVVAAIDAYVKKLEDCPRGQKGVIGCAVVINGQVYCADVYASAGLFAKLWPKLLKAAAVEAVAEKADKKFTPAKEEAVRAFLADAEKGKKSEKKINDRLSQVEREGEKNYLFETRGADGQAPALRRSYVGKVPAAEYAPQAQAGPQTQNRLAPARRQAPRRSVEPR